MINIDDLIKARKEFIENDRVLKQNIKKELKELIFEAYIWKSYAHKPLIESTYTSNKSEVVLIINEIDLDKVYEKEWRLEHKYIIWNNHKIILEILQSKEFKTDLSNDILTFYGLKDDIKEISSGQELEIVVNEKDCESIYGNPYKEIFLTSSYTIYWSELFIKEE